MRGSTTRYWTRVCAITAHAHGLRPDTLRLRGQGGRYTLRIIDPEGRPHDAHAVARTLEEHTGAIISVYGQERAEEEGDPLAAPVDEE